MDKFVVILGLASAVHSYQQIGDLINNGQIEEARNLSIVDPSIFLGVPSYAGLINVNKTFDTRLFFWYFPSDKPLDTPWIIWFQTGTGASTFKGLFNEVGPFVYENGELKVRKYSWAANYSMLFIDHSTGVGFSSTNDTNEYNLQQNADNLYSFLQRFLMLFPELKKPPLFLAGESSAVRIITMFAEKIRLNSDKRNIFVNLEGIILGSPLVNIANIANYTDVYLNLGLIDDQIARVAKPLQDRFFKTIREGNYVAACGLFDELIGRLLDVSFTQSWYHILNDRNPNMKEYAEFIHRPDIKKHLHVYGLDFHPFVGTGCHQTTEYFLYDSRPLIEKLLDRYRILIYGGQFDTIIPCLELGEAIRNKWQWSGKTQFMKAPRNPWWFNEAVVGYFKSGGRLTEVQVRGAGHFPTLDNPAAMQHLISYFIRDLDLHTPPNYENVYGQSWKIPAALDTISRVDIKVLKSIYPNVDDLDLTKVDLKRLDLLIPKENENHLSDDSENLLSVCNPHHTLTISIIANVLLLFLLGFTIIYALRCKRRLVNVMNSTITDDYDEAALTIDRY